MSSHASSPHETKHPAFGPAQGVQARPSPLGGLGVFAARAFAEDELIECAPVLLVPLTEASACAALAPYGFMWDDGHVGLCLGFGSLYNHSYAPNATYADEPGSALPAAKRFVALRPISAGEEITVNYNGDPDDEGPVGFEVG